MYLNWEDLKDGMLIRFKGYQKRGNKNWEYKENKVYKVVRRFGVLGPVDSTGHLPSNNYGFNFTEVKQKTLADVSDYLNTDYDGVWPESAEAIIFNYDSDSWHFVQKDCNEHYFFCSKEDFYNYVEKLITTAKAWGDSGLPPVGSQCYFICNITGKHIPCYIIGTHYFDRDCVLFAENSIVGPISYGYRNQFTKERG